MKNTHEPAEITPEDMETLIAEGRAPFKYGGGKLGNQKVIFFWIPPRGTQEDDIISGANGRGFTFTSLIREVRGMAELRMAPLQEGRRVERRMWDAERALGVDKSSEIAYMFRKAKVWVIDNLF